jgi:hypothetical protein
MKREKGIRENEKKREKKKRGRLNKKGKEGSQGGVVQLMLAFEVCAALRKRISVIRG